MELYIDSLAVLWAAACVCRELSCTGLLPVLVPINCLMCMRNLIPRREFVNIRVYGIELVYCGAYKRIKKTHGVEVYGQYTGIVNANTLLFSHSVGYFCVMVYPGFVGCCLRCSGFAIGI